MNKLKIALTPQAYKLWVIRPEILFIADQLVVDKQDYDEVRQKMDRSLLDRQIAVLMEGLANEGIIEFIEYPKLLSLSERDKIHNLADKIVNDLTNEQKLTLSAHAYKEFSSYLKAKVIYLRSYEPLYNTVVTALKKTEADLKRIEKIIKKEDSLDEKFDKHIRFILGRIFAKWIAGEIISKKIGVYALHDTNEYQPFAKMLREKFAMQEQNVTSLFCGDYRVPLQLVWEALSLTFGTLEIKDIDDLRKLKLSRSEFQIIRNVFLEILKYCQDLEDIELVKTSIQSKVKEAKVFLENKLKNLRVQILNVLPAVVEFALGRFGIPVPLESRIGGFQKALVASIAKSIAKKCLDPFVQLCCFSVYAKRNISISINLKHYKESEKMSKFWILNPSLPWYEVGESIKR